MADDSKSSGGTVKSVIAAVVVALLTGSSAPFWWPAVRDALAGGPPGSPQAPAPPMDGHPSQADAGSAPATTASHDSPPASTGPTAGTGPMATVPMATVAPPPSAIASRYADPGVAAALGAALGPEAEADLGGRVQRFANGTLYWHSATGAFIVGGLILAKYRQMGGPDYGYPITDELPTPDGQGRFNHFRSVDQKEYDKSIYWTPAIGIPHAVYGDIRIAWARSGWERGPLGYPTSDEGDAPGGGRTQGFQHGRINWTPQGGAVVLPGAP